MDTEQVKVSILATVLNEEIFIRQMIKSVAAQDYKNIELIIVDDGSTDGTSQVLSEMQAQYPWLRVISFERNKGKCAAQNAAFLACTGEFVAIHGGDDQSHPSRIACQVSFMEKNAIDACITEMRTVDEDGNTISAVFGMRLRLSSCPALLLKGSSFPAGTVMVTRRLAKRIYPIPEELPYEDRWIAFKIQLHAPSLGLINTALYDYRQHVGNSWVIKDINTARQQYVAIRKMMLRDTAVEKAIYNEMPRGIQSQILKQHNLQQMVYGRMNGVLSLRDLYRSGAFNVTAKPYELILKLAMFFPRAYLIYRVLLRSLAKQFRGRFWHNSSAEIIVPINGCKDSLCCNCKQSKL